MHCMYTYMMMYVCMYVQYIRMYILLLSMPEIISGENTARIRMHTVHICTPYRTEISLTATHAVQWYLYKYKVSVSRHVRM